MQPEASANLAVVGIQRITVGAIGARAAVPRGRVTARPRPPAVGTRPATVAECRATSAHRSRAAATAAVVVTTIAVAAAASVPPAAAVLITARAQPPPRLPAAAATAIAAAGRVRHSGVLPHARLRRLVSALRTVLRPPQRAMGPASGCICPLPGRPSRRRAACSGSIQRGGGAARGGELAQRVRLRDALPAAQRRHRTAHAGAETRRRAAHAAQQTQLVGMQASPLYKLSCHCATEYGAMSSESEKTVLRERTFRELSK
jgi:hypothetical protein